MRIRTFAKLFGLFILALVFTVVTTVTTLHFTSKAALKREQQAWQAIGGVLDHTHYTHVTLPPDQNAGTLWKQAADIVDDRFAIFGNPLLVDIYKLGFRPWELDTDTLRSITDKYPQILKLAYEAANRPSCQLIVDQSDSFIPKQVPYIGRLMIADATVKGRDGRHTQAFESFDHVGTLASHVQTIPTLINYLVSLGLTNMTMGAFQDTFRYTPSLPADALDQLLTRDLLAELQDAFLGDLPISVAVILDDPDFDSINQWPLSIWHRYDLATLIKHARAIHSVVGNAPGTRPYTEYTAELEYIIQDVPSWLLISQTALHGYQYAYPLAAETQTRLTLARTAIRLRGYKQTHGSYPPVDQFDPPPDPYSGGRIRYKLHQDGFILWSDLQKSNGSYITWHWDCDDLPEHLRDVPSSTSSP